MYSLNHYQNLSNVGTQSIYEGETSDKKRDLDGDESERTQVKRGRKTEVSEDTDSSNDATSVYSDSENSDLTTEESYVKADRAGKGLLCALRSRELGATLRTVARETESEIIKDAYLTLNFGTVKTIDKQIWFDIFGKEALDARGITFDDAEARDDRALEKCLTGLDFSKIEGETAEDKVNAGVTILTIPKGLTLEKYSQLLALPNTERSPVQINGIWDPVFEAVGTEEKGATYRVAISNNVLKGSRGLPFAQQLILPLQMGATLPGVLEVVALTTLTKMNPHDKQAKILYGMDTFNLTRTINQIDNSPIVVGGYSGQDILAFPTNQAFALEGIGAAIMKKI